MDNRQQKDKGSPEKTDLGGGFLGFFGGLTNLIGKLNELAEKGGELSKTTEFQGLGSEKGMKGICGWSVKVGLGGDGLKVEPFGNIRTDDSTGKAVVEEVREPLVDVFDEADHVLVVAEMPGVAAKDVKLDVKDDVMTISAERGNKKYRKEVLLPASVLSDKMTVSCNNGVLEIKCPKRDK